MDIIARTFELTFKCILNKYNGETLEYNSPVISEEGSIIISPTDAAASFVSCELTDDVVPLDTTDGEERTFTLSLTMNAEMTSDNEEILLSVNDIGQVVISFADPSNRFVSVTKNELNEIITEEQELDEPYSEQEVEADLQSLTNNWTISSSLKTNYESEYNFAQEILRKHYDNVSGEQISESEWRISFDTPYLTEDTDNDDTTVGSETQWEVSYVFGEDLTEDNIVTKTIVAPDIQSAAKYAEQYIRAMAKEDASWNNASIAGIHKV